MPIDITRLDRSLSGFGTDEGGLFRKGLHVQVRWFLHLQVAVEESSGGRPVTPNLNQVYENIRYIHRDLWDVETLLERIEWTRGLWIEGKIDDDLWSRFTALDIDLFHVTIRSLFDYAAALLRFVSGKPGQIPSSTDEDLESGGRVSFEKLYHWAQKPTVPRRFSPDFVKAIKDCEWFCILRIVRNAIVHWGGQTHMMFDKPRIVFQTVKGRDYSQLVNFPEVMYNENVVDFELYAGMIYGYLLSFLEDVGKLIFNWLSAADKVDQPLSRSQHPGMMVGRRWIEEIRARAIESASHSPSENSAETA